MSPVRIAQNKLEDELGEFIKLDTNLYTEGQHWEKLFHSVKGRSNFTHILLDLSHPARELLSTFARKGVPVLLALEPWSLAEKDATVARGNHPSAHTFS